MRYNSIPFLESIIRKTVNEEMKWISYYDLTLQVDNEFLLSSASKAIKRYVSLAKRNASKNEPVCFVSFDDNTHTILVFAIINNTFLLIIEENKILKCLQISEKKIAMRLYNAIRYSSVDDDFAIADVASEIISEMLVH